MLSFLAVMATVRGRRQMAVNASVGGSNRGGSWAAIYLSLTGAHDCVKYTHDLFTLSQ